MKNFIDLYRIDTMFRALALLVLLASSAAFAQTALQAQLSLRPVTRDDIAAYKLPSTTQASAGLTTIGLGQPAYLDLMINSAIPADQITGVTWTLTGKPAGSNAALADSPLGPEVLAFEPSDRLVSQVASRKLLKPDVAGQYTVTATINTTSSGIATLVLGLSASTYVGIARCTACHSGAMGWDKVTPWSQTNHAKIFKDGMNGVASDHYGQNCLSCHTVGYDATAGVNNGGFSQVAKQLKWTFPTTMKPGTFDALPDQLKNLGNIQCENCHGPGARHAATGIKSAISVTNASGACNQCHAAMTHHFKNGEWGGSRHAIATSYASGAGREACVACHTGTGFIDKAKGATTVNTAYSPINCTTCHDPHENADKEAHQIREVAPKLMDGTVPLESGKGALCMNCHQSRVEAVSYVANTAGSARFGPHHATQADMLLGVNGYTYGQYIPSSAHAYVVEDTCVGCHMQVVAEGTPAFTRAGGHTFKMAAEATATAPAVQLVGACQQCHGNRTTDFTFARVDYDGDGAIDGVQTEVAHLMDKLGSMLPPVGKPKTALAIDATWTKPQLKAAYNWLFVEADKSHGIHNTAYTVGLLKASINDLSGK